ncbi:MAG TPA: ATP-binding protein [Acetobacteraceae bacterium]|nr:ATP-binding protein [Acetobacteraceae bacterium]
MAPVAAKGIGFAVAGSQAMLHTDPVLLESILRNLISNAIRYTQHGEVSVLCHDGDGVVHLEVRDTGPGIPAEQIEQAFEEFQRLDASANADDRGLGLGLAIVRSLANLLDLPVDVWSEVGVGTAFTVAMPLGTPSSGSRGTHPEDRRLGRYSHDRQQCRGRHVDGAGRAP